MPPHPLMFSPLEFSQATSHYESRAFAQTHANEQAHGAEQARASVHEQAHVTERACTKMSKPMKLRKPNEQALLEASCVENVSLLAR